MNPASNGSSRPHLAVLLTVTFLIVAGCGVGPASPSPSSSPTPTATPTLTPVATPSAQAGGSPAPSPSPSPIVHVVAAGDSLLSLARRYDTTGRSIAYWNRATYPSLDPDSADYEPDRIEIGWRLTILPGQVVDPASPPPGPSPTPRPSLTIPPAPTPRPDGTSQVIAAGPRGGNGVALTFDMGGPVEPAIDIVDWLVANDVPATVFPTGRVASETAIGREIMARLAAHPSQFTVGNQTWDHQDLTDLDAPAIEDQLVRTEAVVDELTGRSSKPFFRPPDGSHDLEVRAVAGSLGWFWTVMWDVDTVDWKPVEDGGPTADDIVARVLSRAQGGSIVLLHLGGHHTLEALPRIVEGLRDRGLEPVTLPTMLGG